MLQIEAVSKNILARLSLQALVKFMNSLARMTFIAPMFHK
jgi:hypothetical protein